MNTLETAMKFYGLGVSVFPVVYGEKRPAVPHWTPYQRALPTPDELLRWFNRPANIGIVGGSRNLVIIDFDTQAGYLQWQRWATIQGGRTRQVAQFGYQVQTKRGVHVYVTLPHTERCRTLPGTERIDIKASGGYVLGEGSVHPDGPTYTSLKPGMAILHVPALSSVLPGALLQQLPDLPDFVRPPVPVPPPLLSVDPWDAATSPRQPDPSTGLIARIKRRFSVRDFFPQATVSGGAGRWMTTRCPFHDDAKPSFWLDTERGLCGCFTGCTPKPLDVIDLYAWLYGLTNREAILALAVGV